ncbi:UDP-GlcNAc:undecaprenyl-phosphate GlcNAc-1-phosphate transferase [Roseimicrobium gellanilyticum]|uniref:UDP-GlcNAc:undecaprenyl-phosphate GlcNAc-1-phosphate transferase n=1 Tax=Roseimicrobium gellanilyticum TaxID=748857 RepID=A0A366HS07_9BACT|nr:MraY family glycosyltransferase [Roseimicrobium gellanilyticum]RBP45332.1 UDP-GlcNAc:undecaprenyl-phosphate GlcNAc-1-phosphate transferase [Roseimicrobium gellanilyticum]
MYRYPSLVNVGILLGALLLSAFCTWLLVRYRGSWGLDTPDQNRKFHEKPIPRLGGLGIFVTLVAGFLVMECRFPSFLERWAPVIISNCIIFAIGFADDIRPLGARLKLLGQLGTGTILYALGVSIDELSNPFGEGHFVLGWWSFPVTLVWFISVPNIVNLIDGMDGLATGFGLFLCITLAFVGHYSGKPEVVTVSMIMGGALAGFLIFNFPPARIFLGDGGAYLLGFFIASVTVFTSSKGSVIAALLVVIVALGVPILDTLFAIIRRALMGVPLFRADAEHIHHRLILLGFSKARALIAIYSVCLVLSIVGMSIFWSKGLSLPIAGAALAILALAAARYLGYVRSWRDVRAQFNEALSRRRDMLYAQAYGRVLEWEAERCKDPEEFLSLLALCIERLGLKRHAEADFESVNLSLVTGLVCVIHVPKSAQARVRWTAVAENLIPSLNRATERWGAIQGLVFASPASAPPQSASPTQQESCR